MRSPNLASDSTRCAIEERPSQLGEGLRVGSIDLLAQAATLNRIFRFEEELTYHSGYLLWEHLLHDLSDILVGS